MLRVANLIVASLFLAILTACGGGGGTTTGGSTGGGGTPNPTPAVQHVIVIVFENQNYADVIGSSSMPFFNSVAQANSLATQFYADAHPSIGNYFMMTTGQNPTNNDDSWPGPFSDDNVVRELTTAHETWKVYAESIPSVGYLGGDQGSYVKHHNPFAYFSDVINSSPQAANVVPFTQFSPDLASLPNYAFVVPNNVHNGHDCPNGGSSCPLSDRLTAIDTWFNTNFASVLANSSVMSNTLLIVTFDESATDNTLGGGRIPVIIAGGKFKTGFQSTTSYQFPSLLRFSMDELGVSNIPGAGASANSMSEFLR